MDLLLFLLKNILKEAGYKVGIIGTIENQIDDVVFPSSVTTPESRDLQFLLRQMADKGCGFCIMEASSHALYLDRVAGIPFKAAIFTNLVKHPPRDAWTGSDTRLPSDVPPVDPPPRPVAPEPTM